MILLVGLGNPGKKYINTRHNIGFWIVDKFARKNNFPEFKLSKPFTFFAKKVKGKKFSSLISEGSLDSKKVIIAKPQTFMNQSGKAVKKIITYYQLPVTNLLVVHDDIDLLLGKIRIVKNRGAAGHKGVESIIKEIGTKGFVRFRVGIQPGAKPKEAERFVLQKFKKDEEEIIKEAVNKIVEAIESTLREGLEKSMSEYNK